MKRNEIAKLNSAQAATNRFGIGMLTPTLIVLLVMTAYPLIFTFVYSFTDYNYLKGTENASFVLYNPHRNSIDVYTSAGYMLRIDCWEAEKNLKTTPGSDCALTSLAVDEPLEYARLYLDGNLQMWVNAEDSLEI